MNCGNCKFYDGDNGSCVRHPPQLVLFATDKTASPIVYQTCSAWPNVDPDKWCGEWQAQPFEADKPEETSSGWLDSSKCYKENPFCNDLCSHCRKHKDLHIGSNLACPINLGNEA